MGSVRSTEDVINLITEAFDGVELGDGISIHEAVVIDGYGTSEERAAARLLDNEACWQDISDDVLCKCGYGLYLLEDKGFRFYLPAYLRWSLKNNADSGLHFVDVTINLLNPTSGNYDWHLSLYKSILQKERIAIAEFLRFVVEAYPDYKDETDGLRFWEMASATDAPLTDFRQEHWKT